MAAHYQVTNDNASENHPGYCRMHQWVMIS